METVPGPKMDRTFSWKFDNYVRAFLDG